jgi:hypothetical protein
MNIFKNMKRKKEEKSYLLLGRISAANEAAASGGAPGRACTEQEM